MIECVQDREGLWHVAVAPANPDATFRPILCGPEGMGINMPGPGQEREPTCEECVGLAALAPAAVKASWDSQQDALFDVV